MIRAKMLVNTRIIDTENNRTLYAGDIVEGADAALQLRLGNAEPIEEAPAEAPNATPGAIAHAEATGVDLSTVEGSGVDGRITKADVTAAGSDA